jgi:hypothetical protein
MSRGRKATYLYCTLRLDSERRRGVAPRAANGRGDGHRGGDDDAGVAAPERALAGVPPGVPGAGPVRLLDAGRSLWLVVSDVPLSRFGSAPLEAALRRLDWVSACAMGHERVVEHFVSHGAVLPAKLFTVFTSDQTALARIDAHRGVLGRAFERVAGRDEWGVRVRFDEARALETVRARARRRAPATRPGTGFLVLKKAQKDAARRLLDEARGEIDGLFTRLARMADDARRRTPSATELQARLLLDAAFLVPRRQAPRFRTAVERAGASLTGRGYDVSLTGPWPAYSFVTESA